MIVCPRCSCENEDSAMNCASCRINLQWALENPQEAVRPTLERVKVPPPEAHAENRVVRVFLFIVLLLAVPVSGFLALCSSWNAATSGGSYRSGYEAVAWFWVVLGVVCILAAISVLLPRKLRRRYYRGLRILALIALAGGLLYGLMRLTLVILPEHTGRSLTFQYKLGERDFSGVNLEGVDLSGANLRKANLSGANLGRADLTGANLSWTDLSGAILCEADLSGVYLIGADLREADLREANLTEAKLNQTILHGADLTGAYVTGDQLDQAWNLLGTILPNGSVHE